MEYSGYASPAYNQQPPPDQEQHSQQQQQQQQPSASPQALQHAMANMSLENAMVPPPARPRRKPLPASSTQAQQSAGFHQLPLFQPTPAPSPHTANLAARPVPMQQSGFAWKSTTPPVYEMTAPFGNVYPVTPTTPVRAIPTVQTFIAELPGSEPMLIPGNQGVQTEPVVESNLASTGSSRVSLHTASPPHPPLAIQDSEGLIVVDKTPSSDLGFEVKPNVQFLSPGSSFSSAHQSTPNLLDNIVPGSAPPERPFQGRTVSGPGPSILPSDARSSIQRSLSTFQPGSRYAHTSTSFSEFANSVFSKDTVRWSKKTASRLGGAIKTAASTAHAAATNAQAAAAQAHALRRQRSLIASHQPATPAIHGVQSSNPAQPQQSVWPHSGSPVSAPLYPQQTGPAAWPPPHAAAQAPSPMTPVSGPWNTGQQQAPYIQAPAPYYVPLTSPTAVVAGATQGTSIQAPDVQWGPGQNQAWTTTPGYDAQLPQCAPQQVYSPPSFHPTAAPWPHTPAQEYGGTQTLHHQSVMAPSRQVPQAHAPQQPAMPAQSAPAQPAQLPPAPASESLASVALPSAPAPARLPVPAGPEQLDHYPYQTYGALPLLPPDGFGYGASHNPSSQMPQPNLVQQSSSELKRPGHEEEAGVVQQQGATTTGEQGGAVEPSEQEKSASLAPPVVAVALPAVLDRLVNNKNEGKTAEVTEDVFESTTDRSLPEDVGVHEGSQAEAKDDDRALKSGTMNAKVETADSAGSPLPCEPKEGEADQVEIQG